ncbi:MAG TPA: hypothetical protein ENK06_00120 [Gammaproteobacteria bacterium]|nr:hypothetical protein [Gammaproteobacteria bacterium]
MKIITGFELTDTATRRFNNWVKKIGNENLDLIAVTLEALNSFESDVMSGDDPDYELGSQFTNTSRPETFFLNKNEYVAQWEDDGCDD